MFLSVFKCIFWGLWQNWRRQRFLEYLGEKLLGVTSVFGGVSFSLNLTHSKSAVPTHAVFWEVSIGGTTPPLSSELSWGSRPERQDYCRGW